MSKKRNVPEYVLYSTKGQHGEVRHFHAACKRAREVQAEVQAAYGVSVENALSGLVVYTAL